MRPKRIVATGPESTGKSTLCAALAQELQTVWVPEYARAYVEQLDRPYNEADLLTIANGQAASEDELASQANKYLLCDTDLYVIKVWGEYKYNRSHPQILQQIATRKYDLYLLTATDLDWEYDPLREYPDLEMRNYFYKIYQDIVVNSGVPFAAISGTHEERVATALQAIKNLG